MKRGFCCVGLIGLIELMGCGGIADEGKPAPGSIVGGVEAEAAKGSNGEPCKDPSGSECYSGVCFVGGQQSFCSLRCSSENAQQVCVAPFTGTCNQRGYCKRD